MRILSSHFQAVKRCFTSSTTRLKVVGTTYTRPVVTTKYIQLFAVETKDSVWQLLNSMAHGRRLLLVQALQRNGVSWEEFTRWKETFSASNIDAVVSNLETKGYIVREARETRFQIPRHIPPWVLLYLLGYKVRAAHHVTNSMLPMTVSTLPALPPHLQAGALVLSLFHLARFNMIAPVSNLVDMFLLLPLSHADATLFFNTMLQGLSRTRAKSVATADIALRLLKAMESRELKLHSHTYLKLLDDRFVTIQLTKYLRERMTAEGVVPTAEHLEAYLRVFSRNGMISDAQAYREHLRSIASRGEADPQLRTRTDHDTISHFTDGASAFAFLRKLSLQSYHTPTRLKPRHSFTIYDWTAAFSVAVSDPSISTKRLFKLFRAAKESTSSSHRPAYRPTVATYTVFLRALLRRKAYRHAITCWNDLISSGLPIDRRALLAGLQALIRAGKPHTALYTLEAYCKRVDVAAPARHKPSSPVVWNIIAMNDFLVALLRISRPDVVLAFWDRMFPLYSVQPDERTLSIIMQAVRMAVRKDDTIWGKLNEMRSWWKTKTSTTPSTDSQSSLSRDEVFEGISQLLVASMTSRNRKGLKAYTSGIWDGHSPVIHLKTIFFNILFSSYPELLELNTPPIAAVSVGADSDGFSLLKTLPSLALSTRLRTHWVPTASTHAFLSQKRTYPGIILSEKNFQDFLIFLGTASYPPPALSPPRSLGISQESWKRPLTQVSTTEIPLILSWMRRIGMKPSQVTMAIALVLWREVNLVPPLIDAWTSRGNNQPRVGTVVPSLELDVPSTASPTPRGMGIGDMQYQKLVRWLEEWLGADNVPRDNSAVVMRWRSYIEKMRSMRG